MTAPRTRTDAPGEAIAPACVYCHSPMPAKRRGRYCCPAHRTAYSREFGVRGIVSRRAILGNGEVSIVLRFGIEDRERALRISDGMVLEVVQT